MSPLMVCILLYIYHAVLILKKFRFYLFLFSKIRSIFHFHLLFYLLFFNVLILLSFFEIHWSILYSHLSRCVAFFNHIWNSKFQLFNILLWFVFYSSFSMLLFLEFKYFMYFQNMHFSIFLSISYVQLLL